MTYAAKLPGSASSHRIDASSFGDPSKGEHGSAARRGADRHRHRRRSASIERTAATTRRCATTASSARRWLIEGASPARYNHIAETPRVNEWRVTDRPWCRTCITGGIGVYEQGNKGTNLQFTVKSPHLHAPAITRSAAASCTRTSSTRRSTSARARPSRARRPDDRNRRADHHPARHRRSAGSTA